MELLIEFLTENIGLVGFPLVMLGIYFVTEVLCNLFSFCSFIADADEKSFKRQVKHAVKEVLEDEK